MAARARAVFITCFLCVIVLALSSCSPRKQGVSEEKTDRLLTDGEVITKVEKMPGCETRLGEAIGVVDASREKVWRVICDYNEHKHFMPNILECFAIRLEALELIKGKSPRELRGLESQLRQYKTGEIAGEVVYIYSVGDFPWPIPDKAYILKIARDRERYATHATMIIGQMRVNESFWELKPYGADGSKTLVKYRLLLDPGMPAPAFVIRMATSSIMPKVIEAVRQRVKNARYGHPRREGRQAG